MKRARHAGRSMDDPLSPSHSFLVKEELLGVLCWGLALQPPEFAPFNGCAGVARQTNVTL